MEYEINVQGADRVSSWGCWGYAFFPVKKFRANPHKISICLEGGPFGAMIVCDG